ncbi:hypothetical protein ACLOJK_039864 [Asimina triloba]
MGGSHGCHRRSYSPPAGGPPRQAAVDRPSPPPSPPCPSTASPSPLTPTEATVHCRRNPPCMGHHRSNPSHPSDSRQRALLRSGEAATRLHEDSEIGTSTSPSLHTKTLLPPPIIDHHSILIFMAHRKGSDPTIDQGQGVVNHFLLRGHPTVDSDEDKPIAIDAGEAGISRSRPSIVSAISTRVCPPLPVAATRVACAGSVARVRLPAPASR